MKYIDADKLYREVDERMAHFAVLEKETKPDDEDLSIFYQGKVKMCSELLDIIDSLQQEQTEVDLEKEMDKYYGMYRDKTGKTYDIKDGEPCFDWKEDGLSEHEMRFARHFYELGLNAINGEQEQQEVDLEGFTEKMDAWKARFNHPDDIPIKATMAFTARMFYQYPDVARQWYEQLPKATMDFSARKEKEE